MHRMHYVMHAHALCKNKKYPGNDLRKWPGALNPVFLMPRSDCTFVKGVRELVGINYERVQDTIKFSFERRIEKKLPRDSEIEP